MKLLRKAVHRLAAIVRRRTVLPMHATVAADAYISPYAYLDWNHGAQITIDDGAVVTAHAAILAHDSAGAGRSGLTWVAPVHLKKGCYVGYGAIVLPGVTVGEHAIIGAGSVVTADVPDDAVVAGAPARVIGSATELVEARRATAKRRGVFPGSHARPPLSRQALDEIRRAGGAGGYFIGPERVHGVDEASLSPRSPSDAPVHPVSPSASQQPEHPDSNPAV